jgi:ribosome-associated toxin RatA of RatAB toxin-antitoxin module
MAYVRFEAYSETAAPDEVYAQLADLESYPSRTDAVRSVLMHEETDGTKYSNWEVNFRGGVLRWSEFDRYDSDARCIAFDRRDGDPARLAGEWKVIEQPTGCSVSFTADFDMGMATFADVLNPLAERAMRDNVERIIGGILGPEHEVTAREPALELAVAGT